MKGAFHAFPRKIDTSLKKPIFPFLKSRLFIPFLFHTPHFSRLQ